MLEIAQNDTPPVETKQVTAPRSADTVDRNSPEYRAQLERAMQESLQLAQFESANRIFGPLYRRG